MSSNQLPGPVGTRAFPTPAIEDGTLARCMTPQPGIAGYTAPLVATGPARSWIDVAARVGCGEERTASVEIRPE